MSLSGRVLAEYRGPGLLHRAVGPPFVIAQGERARLVYDQRVGQYRVDLRNPMAGETWRAIARRDGPLGVRFVPVAVRSGATL